MQVQSAIAGEVDGCEFTFEFCEFAHEDRSLGFFEILPDFAQFSTSGWFEDDVFCAGWVVIVGAVGEDFGDGGGGIALYYSTS